MAEPDASEIDEAELRLINSRDLIIDLCPLDDNNSIRSRVGWNLDTDANFISRVTLKTFRAFRRTLWTRSRPCPAVGKVVELSLRHPDFGIAGGDFEFQVVGDMSVGVVLGRAACRVVLQQWTSDRQGLSIALLVRERREKGLPIVHLLPESILILDRHSEHSGVPANGRTAFLE